MLSEDNAQKAKAERGSTSESAASGNKEGSGLNKISPMKVSVTSQIKK